MGIIFIRLAAVASQTCGITQNSEIPFIAVQGHLGSSILIPIESPCATSY